MQHAEVREQTKTKKQTKTDLSSPPVVVTLSLTSQMQDHLPSHGSHNVPTQKKKKIKESSGATLSRYSLSLRFHRSYCTLCDCSHVSCSLPSLLRMSPRSSVVGRLSAALCSVTASTVEVASSHSPCAIDNTVQRCRSSRGMVTCATPSRRMGEAGGAPWWRVAAAHSLLRFVPLLELNCGATVDKPMSLPLHGLSAIEYQQRS